MRSISLSIISKDRVETLAMVGRMNGDEDDDEDRDDDDGDRDDNDDGKSLI